jgi:ALG11 mannosyltransferase N-terminus
MGYAFSFNVVLILGGVNVGAYVHYPTISTEMLVRVRSRKRGHTNSDVISSSTILSQGKLLYVHQWPFCCHGDSITRQVLPILHVLLRPISAQGVVCHGQLVVDEGTYRLRFDPYRPTDRVSALLASVDFVESDGVIETS